MKLRVVESYDEMSKLTAKEIVTRITTNHSFTLGLATGSTPEGVYKSLIEEHKRNGISFENVSTFNLDEYIGLDPTHKNSYHCFMQQKLFSYINIFKSNIHIPKGNTSNHQEECLRYESIIKASGGIALQILGIGKNGHIGFNEPGTDFSSRTHIVNLTESTRAANARFFSTPEEVPTQAITMGISSILDSKEIFLLVSGHQKAEALHKLLTTDCDNMFPASSLKNHSNVTIIADSDAATLL